MAMDAEVRRQILLGISVDGTDAPGKLTAEIARLNAQIKTTSEEFATSTGGAKEYTKEIIALVGQITKLQKLLNELAKGEKELAAAHNEAANAAKEEFLAEMNLDAALQKISASEKQLAQDEQRMLKERLAMIQAMKDGVVVMGHNGQALIDDALAELKAAEAAKKLTTEEEKLTQSILAAGRAQSGMTGATAQFTAQANQGVQASNRFGYGMLNISHAIQDAQYGFGAVLNNIPLVVTALGGGPGLAGTIMVVGVALNAAAPYIKDFAANLGLVTDASKVVSDGLEANKDKLKALTDKPWKVEVDYVAIEETTKKIEDLEERKRALDETKDKFGDKAVGEHGKDAIRAGGGRDAVVGQIQAAIRASGRERALYDESDIQWLRIHEVTQKSFETSATKLTGPARWLAEHEASVAAGRAEAIRDRMRKQLRAKAEKLAGGVAAGDEGDIAGVGALMKAAPGVFGEDFAHEFGMMPKTAQEAQNLEDAEIRRNDREDRAIKLRKKKEIERQQLIDRGAANAFAMNQQRAQDITREATRVATQLAKDISPGGLPAQVAGGFAAGATDEMVRDKVRSLVEQRAQVAGVPASMMKEVVGEIIGKEIDKIRAEAAANSGDLRQGAAEIVNEMAARLAQQQDTAARKPINRAARDASDAAKARQQAVAEDIQAHTGFSPEVAQVAAKDAINRMRHGMDQTTASWAAVNDMMEHLVLINIETAGNQALFMQKLAHLEARIQGAQQNVRQVNRAAQRMNNARPAMQGWQQR